MPWRRLSPQHLLPAPEHPTGRRPQPDPPQLLPGVKEPGPAEQTVLTGSPAGGVSGRRRGATALERRGG